MKKEIRAGDLMTRNFVAVKSNISLHQCAKVMSRKRVDCVIVVDKCKVLGIINYEDMLWALKKFPNKTIHNLKVKDVVPSNTPVIFPSTSIDKALSIMRKHSMSKLPVAIRHELVGIISSSDLLMVEPSLFEVLREVAEIREEKQKIQQIKASNSWCSEGLCEECGKADLLYRQDGGLLCLECRKEAQ